MQIACKCAQCGNIHMTRDDDDLCLEIDFRNKTIIFVCRNEKCRHENKLDLDNWQENQKKSPLPPMSILRG